jgi:hypothetical protein
MEQIITDVPAQKSRLHPRADAATVTDVMRPPLTTVTQHDHVAAAAYLMKHGGTTALIVTDAQTGQPAGIITEADITDAIADGNDPRAAAPTASRQGRRGQGVLRLPPPRCARPRECPRAGLRSASAGPA